MIQANELRIGNWVNYVSTGIDDIIQITCLQVGEHLGDSFKPIPLTEEWLERFGFELMDYDIYSESENETEVYITYKIKQHKFEYRVELSERGRNTFNVKWRWADEGQLCEVPYVHSLQNIYFALTGEELTIIEEEL